jgi:hypothetical protein
MSSLLIRIYERGRQVYWGEFDAAVELGPQTLDDPQPSWRNRYAPTSPGRAPGAMLSAYNVR